MTTYQRALHIFRRDLRLHDNTALHAALKLSKEVIPCFIFNDAQVAPHPYRSVNGLAFMIESLEELAADIRKAGGELLVCHGAHHEVVAKLIKECGIDAVFFNRDYTPFSRTRDQAIEDTCKSLGVACQHFSDALLVEPRDFAKDDGRPYTVYTPFFKKASRIPVTKPVGLQRGSLGTCTYSGKRASPRDFWPKDQSPERVSHGGRSCALTILESIRNFSNYEEERNLPAVRGTTLLAPHNKFGTVSIREVYHSVSQALGATHTLIRELYWRDFFTHIAWHFPHVFGHAFHKHYDAIEWNDDPQLFERWCQGETGFPIVDAGMRELVTTGFMHNRVRMIVASFLVKDLHISWQKGEMFFARYLTDYDPAVNNGSWQWAASTGCDAQPYFRIFNPWLQQKRFDPECAYVKRWVPELKQLKPAYIHTMYEDDMTRSVNYPKPIVEHSVQKLHAEEMFRRCVGGK
jgi:deoxyribodipyrimidine photo-lyase